MAYAQGVKFLKINKTDALGNDKTSNLAQLKSIRINYSDIGVVQYNVFGATEYPTYFLYQVNYKDSISTIDKGVSNYILEATASVAATALNVDDYQQVASYDSETIPNEHFDALTGVYTIKDSEHYPNTIITYTASVEYRDGTTGYPVYPKLILATGDTAPGTVIQEFTPGAVSDPGTIIISGSLPGAIPSNVNYFLIVSASSAGSGHDIDFTNAVFRVSQSIAPTGNTALLTVPNPDSSIKFESTDCDTTYGWIDDYPLSQYYMDVDYTTGTTVPTNQVAIVSGTAVLAPVKDYYYNLQAQTLPRYQGSRVSQLQLNKYTGPTSTINFDGSSYLGDTGYGKSPNVESRRAYFAWFTEVYGASPEYNNAINVNIKYLIDELGNTYTPGLTKYFEKELIATLSQGEEAELNFVDAVGGTNSTPTTIKIALNGQRTVIRPGVKASAVLYSQTGSSVGAYTQSLQFTTIEDGSAYKSLTDYRFGVQQYGTQIIPAGSGYTQVTFTTENWDFANGYSTGSSRYTFGSTPQSKIRFKINLGEIYTNSSEAYKVVLKKNGTTDLYSQQVKGGGGSTTSAFTITTDYYNFQSGDYLEILIQQITSPINIAYDGTRVEWLAEQELLMQQTLPSITAPFFFTSSTDPYILTASLQFSSSINQVYQVALSGSGFDPIRYKVSFEPGDQLRFENNEVNTYTINRIISSSTAQGSNGQTVILLDRPITNGTNVDYFLLRRFAPDPANVIIQGMKPSGGTGAGTLKPVYITEGLDANMASIISKLNSENAI